MKKRQCGIYFFEATNILSSKFGGKYIGKSIDIHERKLDHLSELRQDKHLNPRLKAYFNKYGEKFLKFGILMECPENELNFWEKWWIKCLDSRNYFNDTDGGDGGPIFRKKCRMQNIKTKEIVEYESILEFSNKYGLEGSSVSRVLKGKLNYTGDWFCPDNKWRPKIYQLRDPNGKVHNFKEIKEFSKINNLNEVCVSRLLLGKNINHKGWTNPTGKKKAENHPISKSYSLISPNGIVHQGQNLSKFAKEQGIHPGNLQRLINNKKYSYKGWRFYENGDKIEKFVFKTYEYKLKSPDGQVFITNNLTKFARDNNLSQGHLQSVDKERRPHHKGWTKYKE